MSDGMMNLELIDCEEMNVHTVVDRSIRQSHLSSPILSFSAEQGAILPCMRKYSCNPWPVGRCGAYIRTIDMYSVPHYANLLKTNAPSPTSKQTPASNFSRADDLNPLVAVLFLGSTVGGRIMIATVVAWLTDV